MKEERPVTRAEMEALKSDIARAMESGAQRSTVQFADGELVLERTSDGGLTVSAPGQPSASRFFMGAPERPAGYPADLPFVPDEPVMVSIPRENASSLTWFAPRDPDQVFAQLEQQTVADGWQLSHRHELKEMPILQLAYQKGHVQRMVLLSLPGVVTVLQKLDDGRGMAYGHAATNVE
jgi:hypothetical protein